MRRKKICRDKSIKPNVIVCVCVCVCVCVVCVSVSMIKHICTTLHCTLCSVLTLLPSSRQKDPLPSPSMATTTTHTGHNIHVQM